VVGERLADHAAAVRPAQIEPRRRIGDERVGRRSPEPRDHGIAVGVGEVDEHAAAAGIRCERHPQQSALPVGRRHRPEIEERSREHRRSLHGLDQAVLLDGIEHAGLQRIGDGRDQLRQVRGDGLGAELRVGGGAIDRQEERNREKQAAHGRKTYTKGR
jgi:hypothetical protein